MYFVDLNADDGGLKALKLVPLQIRNFPLCICARADFHFILETLKRECQPYDTSISAGPEGQLVVSRRAKTAASSPATWNRAARARAGNLFPYRRL